MTDLLWAEAPRKGRRVPDRVANIHDRRYIHKHCE
jgi:hypothetical protein